jgi:hypothetical protein
LAFQSLHRESLLINASFCRWPACFEELHPTKRYLLYAQLSLFQQNFHT